MGEELIPPDKPNQILFNFLQLVYKENWLDGIEKDSDGLKQRNISTHSKRLIEPFSFITCTRTIRTLFQVWSNHKDVYKIEKWSFRHGRK